MRTGRIAGTLSAMPIPVLFSAYFRVFEYLGGSVCAKFSSISDVQEKVKQTKSDIF